jgi:hypothetical protein
LEVDGEDKAVVKSCEQQSVRFHGLLFHCDDDNFFGLILSSSIFVFLLTFMNCFEGFPQRLLPQTTKPPGNKITHHRCDVAESSSPPDKRCAGITILVGSQNFRQFFSLKRGIQTDNSYKDGTHLLFPLFHLFLSFLLFDHLVFSN